MIQAFDVSDRKKRHKLVSKRSSKVKAGWQNAEYFGDRAKRTVSVSAKHIFCVASRTPRFCGSRGTTMPLWAKILKKVQF